ncbi:MAG TPA: hypothetical protein VKF36_22855 [Syntrophorhabdales bacterium]|nr:hypothetical protein [Syntrophorhabdales bacterium]
MKRIYLFIACCFLLYQGTALAGGEGYLQGAIISSFADRLDLSLGDKVIINLGSGQGVTKGDIAKIARQNAQEPLINNIGQCAVVDTGEASSVCEIIRSKVEIHTGDAVFLKAVNAPADTAFFPMALKTLYSAVNGYDPSKKLSVCVYTIFDEKNEVTALSDRIRQEILGVMQQKSRINLVDSGTTMEAFYPTDDMQWIGDVRQFMKKAGVDVLITGMYAISKDQLVISIYKIDSNGDDRKMSFLVPAQESFRQLASQVRAPYQEIRKKEQVFCYFVLKPFSYTPVKDEKVALIKFEADGNPFTEYAMRRDDFNIISPVDVLLEVDGDVFSLSGHRPQQLVTLTKGTHRVSASFRRGYYFNENLLYISRNLLKKEAILDISKSTSILIDLSINPLPEKQPITIQVFDRVGKERQLIRPIRKLADDTTVETFKD